MLTFMGTLHEDCDTDATKQQNTGNWFYKALFYFILYEGSILGEQFN